MQKDAEAAEKRKGSELHDLRSMVDEALRVGGDSYSRAWVQLRERSAAHLHKWGAEPAPADTDRETGSLVVPVGHDNPGPTSESSPVKGVIPHSQGESQEAANGAISQSDPGTASASDTRLSSPEVLVEETRKLVTAQLETITNEMLWFVMGLVAETYVKGRAEERRDVLTDLRGWGNSGHPFPSASTTERLLLKTAADRFNQGEHVAKADEANRG
jgi:hypothetical protein